MTLEVFQIGARPDLDEEISNGNLSVKGRFLDLGTGPATQAVQVSRKGFSVTGFELSRFAVYRAMEVYANELNVVFVIDNILDSKLNDDQYDYLFDLGCLHVFQPDDRPPQHIILYALYTMHDIHNA